MKRPNPFVALAAALVLGACGLVQAQNLLVNGDLDLGLHEVDLNPPWVLVEGPNTMPLPPGVPMPANAATFASFANNTPANPLDADGVQVGLWLRSFQGGLNAEQPPQVFAHLTQTVPGVAGLPYQLSAWSRFETFYSGGVDNLNVEGADPPDDGPPSPTDTFLALEFLDAANSVLPGSVVTELRADGQLNDGVWRQHFLSAVAPAGTVLVQVRGSMVDGLLNPNVNPQSAFMDDFVLVVPEPATVALSLIAVLGVLGLMRRR